MLSKGTAKKVTIYVNEDTQHHLVPLYESILAFLVHKGVSGATVTRALAGFGAHRVVHTPVQSSRTGSAKSSVFFVVQGKSCRERYSISRTPQACRGVS